MRGTVRSRGGRAVLVGVRSNVRIALTGKRSMLSQRTPFLRIAHANFMDWKLVMKIVSGIVVVPISVISTVVWTWWEKATPVKKVISAPFIMPMILIAWIITPWWNDL